MSIIDRYVIRQVLVPFVLGLLVFTFVFIIPELVRYAESLVEKGVPGIVVATLLVKLIPFGLSLTIPMSLLLALLIAFGKLSADREFVAMQACGVSLLRLLRPVGLIAVSGWLATTYVLVWGVPAANQSFREQIFNIAAQRAEGEVKPRIFYDQFRDLILYVRDVPPSGTAWNGIFVADMRPNRGNPVLLARTGHVSINREKRLIDMVLQGGTRHTTANDGHYDVLTFEEQVVTIDPTSEFLSGSIPKGPQEMSIAELREEIAEKESRIDPATGRPFSPHNEWMAIHQKFSIPVACLVFGLIGLALGATNRRDGLLGNFVLGLIVIFAYYVPLYLGPQLVKGGLLPVWLGKWLPNLILGALGIMLFVWRDRVADQPIALTVPAWLRERRSGRPSMMRFAGISILDRYVTATYGRFFLLSSVALLGVFYLSTFLQMADKVFKGTTTWTQLGDYFWYATPQWVYYVLPLSVLMASLVTIAILTKNSELIVMKACGISLYRIALPILGSAVMVGGLLFGMEETILGASNKEAEALRHVIRGGEPATFNVLHRGWLVGSRGEIYHYEWFDPRKGILSQLSVYEFTDGMQQITRRTYAEVATYMPGDEEGEGDTWKLERGWTREFDEAGKVVSFAGIAAEDRRLESPGYFGTEPPRPEFMGYTQLRDHLAVLRGSGFDVLKEEVAVARKLAFPFVTIVMALIAVPFAVTIGRSGAMGGIGVGIGLAITYWMVISTFAAIGAGGLLTPVLAAWAPNLLFGAGAVYLLLTVRT